MNENGKALDPELIVKVPPTLKFVVSALSPKNETPFGITRVPGILNVSPLSKNIEVLMLRESSICSVAETTYLLKLSPG